MANLFIPAGVVLWFAAIIVLEQRYPVVAVPRRAYLANVLIMFVATLVSLPLAGVLGASSKWLIDTFGLALYAIDFDAFGLGVAWLDPVLRTLALIFLPLLIHDAWLNLSHRIEHRVPALWHVHRVHHSDRWMNALTVFRDHFLQVVWRSFFPVFTLGLFVDMSYAQAAEAATYSQLFLFALASLAHSNIRVELPWLDRILVTPQVHRIHHSVLPEHSDKNFSDIFPLFDMILGTYVKPRRGEFPETGLSDGERLDTALTATLAPFRTWLTPLRRKRSDAAAAADRQA